jgi:excisionase family DNA binding protein
MTTVSRTKRIADIMTPEQAAAALGVSLATLWRMRGRGELTAWHVLGRTVFMKTNVEAALRKRQQMAAG